MEAKFNKFNLQFCLRHWIYQLSFSGLNLLKLYWMRTPGTGRSKAEDLDINRLFFLFIYLWKEDRWHREKAGCLVILETLMQISVSCLSFSVLRVTPHPRGHKAAALLSSLCFHLSLQWRERDPVDLPHPLLSLLSTPNVHLLSPTRHKP